MKNNKKEPKKVNVVAVVDALKVQSKVRAGILSVVGKGPCPTCGINSGHQG
jgi:hypothetical protein